MMPEIPAHSNEKIQIERRLDDLVGVTGALISVGLVVGNIGFETLIVATGLFWISRCVVAKKNPLPDLIPHPLAFEVICRLVENMESSQATHWTFCLMASCQIFSGSW